MNDLIIGWRISSQPENRKKWKSDKANAYGNIKNAQTYDDDGHLITFAPTGAGKGVSVIIPNLLHYPGPIITIDPKGENFAITAKYRKNVLKQRIFLLDPFEFVKEETLKEIGVDRSSLNPLDLISSNEVDMDVQLTMTASLLAQSGSLLVGSMGNDEFWHNEAQKLIVGVLGATIQSARLKNESPKFEDFINQLYTDDNVYNLAVILDTIGKKLPSIVYKSLAAFLQKADKERSGVMSTAQSYVNPFMSPSLSRYLNNSSISMDDLSKHEDYTIYIVIPPSKLVSHSVLLRIWISSMLNAIMEREEKPEMKTLFLLDECAQLGYLDGLRKAITLLRGYGLQVWMFFQDFAQLEAIYDKEHATIINNCGVFQSFGISRNFSAKKIKETIGEFTEDQLVSLDKTQQVVSIAGRNPEILRSCNYLSDRLFYGKFDKNPLYKPKKKKKEIYPFPINHIKTH